MLITFTVDFLYWTGFGVCDVKLARNIRRMFVTLLLLIGLLRWVKKSRNIIISFQQAIDYRVKVSGETLFVWLSKHPSSPPPDCALRQRQILLCWSSIHELAVCQKFISLYKTFTPFLSVLLLFWYFTQIKKLSPFHMLNMLVKTETEFFYCCRN